MKNYLITGGAGFIGSHFVEMVCAMQNRAIVLDKMTYAADIKNLKSVENTPNFKLIKGDIADQDLVTKILREEQIDFVVNFAAESHVDNSIKAPESFIQTNIVGTFNLLNCALAYFRNLDGEKKSQFRFLHVSTDEVYGSLSLTDPKFNEENPYKPNSPYSASKAASDHLVRAWFETYDLPTITTNCSNNFGPHQHREKFIPTVIYSAISNKNIPIYGNGKNIRDWIFVKDHARGILMALQKGRIGQTYCFGGQGENFSSEKENIDLANEICEILDQVKPKADGTSYKKQISFVTDRMGHDKRYAISNDKVAREFGFAPSQSFSERLKETVLWYLQQNQ